MITNPLEEYTRQLIDINLRNLGWTLEKGNDQNVWLGQPRTEAERKKLGGKRPDYVLYSKESETPLIVIEAKRPGKRIDTALEQGIQYARILDAPLVFATDGVFCKSFHTIFDRTPVLNGDEVDEFIKESTAIKFLDEWNVNTISSKVQYDRRELIRIFDEANNMLRGDGLRAGIERFGEFANILFLKLISESEQIKRESGIESSFDFAYSWDAIKKTPASARIDYLNNIVFKNLNTLYDKSGAGIFTSLTIRDNSILKEIMDKLDPLTLTDVDSDVKGDAFEYFLRESTSTKNDLGEYFTPRHIVKTMVRLVDPQYGEKIYDPFCGTGGFLIETYRHIYDRMPQNPGNKKVLQEGTIYGNEITNTARITKMNMILAGDGHSNINMWDSLLNPVNEEYDVVLTNMPYSQKTKHGGLYELPSSNGDSICIQHCMKAINAAAENGRMALVVPEGFLFRKDLTKTREYLLERAQLQSIISLPQGVFLPYTGVKTSVIFATKVNQKLKSSEKRNDYWYFEVKNDGFTLDNNRRKTDMQSDLMVYEEYRKLDDSQKDEMLQEGFELVSYDEIRDDALILVGSRYRKNVSHHTEYSFNELRNLCDIVGGYAFKSADLSMTKQEGFLPVIKIGNLTATGSIDFGNIEYHKFQHSLEKYLISREDILVAMTGATVGKVSISNDNDLLLNQRVANVKPHLGKLDKRYLFYLLSSEKFYSFCQSVASGVAQGNISTSDIGAFEIPIPTLGEQQQIANELDCNQKIVNGARLIAEQYRPSINIDPQWETVKLGELFTSVSETIDPQSNKGMVAYIGLENIEPDKGLIIGDINVDIKTIKSTKRVFEKGDILYGRLRPNLNKVWFAEFSGICSTDIAVLRPKDSDVLAEFYAVLMREESFNLKVLNGVSGGQLPRVDIQYLLKLPIHNTSKQQQQQIIEQLKAELALIEPAKKLIDVFMNKIDVRIEEIWGGKIGNP